ncbi:MAG TPA: murein biosynthesis integral membrane protein MurJ [Gammaproteobacteria bacterium]|nr:murein biosynthesis integral membrane protein MurJ [Gammaproteobacteria bacterium]
MAAAAGEPSVDEPAPPPGSGAAAFFVGLGILLSRIVGLVRERVLATYFGTGLHADVFAAGMRLPNVLQNLLGEGTLSASFIPAYSALLGQGRREEAGRVAGAAFALLLAVAGAIALVGVLLAPLIVSVFTPGFTGHRRDLLIAVVRITFPMTGVLVLSAWALGILNSHRTFFLPYFAPVLWNAAIIGAFVALGSRLDLDALVVAVAWGALLGGVLQFAVQLPAVWRLDREIRIGAGKSEPAFREAVRKAGPAIMGRGVVQISAYVDMWLASLLAVGAMGQLRYAQTLYMLPISLFAMSVAAAALPELARERDAAIGALRERAVAALRRVAFFVVPSLVAFVGLGDVLVAGLYRAGEFGDADVRIVWLILVGYSAGLLASTTTRIYQSAFFALRDTVTPARAAVVRVIVALTTGAVLMVQFESITVLGLTIPAGLFASFDALGLPLGPLGLAAGASLGAWVEWALLKRALRAHVGGVGAGAAPLVRMFASAVAAAAGAYAASRWLSAHALLEAVVAAAVFGAIYLAMAAALGLEQAGALLKRFRRPGT